MNKQNRGKRWLSSGLEAIQSLSFDTLRDSTATLQRALIAYRNHFASPFHTASERCCGIAKLVSTNDKGFRMIAEPLVEQIQMTHEPSVGTRAIVTTSILEQIGNTPLLDLSDFAYERGVSPDVQVLAKAEWFNPGGSVKSRPALRIIEDAEARGDLGNGQILIDSSSGNTAIGFALIGSVKGIPVHLVMPANVSEERKALVRAYGATLIESDPLEGSDGAIHKVREIVASDPERYFYADQYSNDANWQAHFDTTGPEIWRQTEGAITHFVAGLGTTGTFTGVGRYLKTVNPDVRLIALQPEDELAVIEGLKHLETAIVPAIYDENLPDRHITVGPSEALDTTIALVRTAGLFVGISAGAAVAASIDVAKDLDKGCVVTILPDDGSKYVSLGIYG